MFLSDKELRDAVMDQHIIHDASDDRIANIAYDILIDRIFPLGTNDGKVTSSKIEYDLKPHETVFISSKETLNLPANFFATVIPRNSCIRQGLDIVAPVYQPGHKSKFFIRVTNISDDIIILKKNSSVASVMLYRLNSNVCTPYDGIYSNEFDYKGVGHFHSIPIPSTRKLEKKIESIRDLEKSIYGTVITIMTVFISIFSLINLNSSFLGECTTIKALISYNLVTVGSIFALVGLTVGILIPRADEERKRAFGPMIAILILAAVMIVISAILSV